jgi:hypothetical protein
VKLRRTWRVLRLSRADVEALYIAMEEYRAIEGGNVERTLRGEQITEMFAEPEGILRLAQDAAKVLCGGAR